MEQVNNEEKREDLGPFYHGMTSPEKASHTIEDYLPSEWAIVCKVLGCDPRRTVRIDVPPASTEVYIDPEKATAFMDSENSLDNIAFEEEIRILLRRDTLREKLNAVPGSDAFVRYDGSMLCSTLGGLHCITHCDELRADPSFVSLRVLLERMHPDLFGEPESIPSDLVELYSADYRILSKDEW